MGFPFAAVASAVLPGLVSGITGNNAQKRGISAERAKELRERYYFGRDRKNERKYQAKVTKKDRKYAEKRLADDRRYAASVTAADRAYSESIYKRDRATFVADRDLAAKEFKADRSAQQRLADLQAEKAAASRSLDFAALRDDAVKAGYNPLTALQFATSYARDVNYGVEGGVYGGYGAASPVGGGAASTSAGPGVVPGTSPASYASPGGGFTSTTSAPILSSRDALLQAGVDGLITYFNEQDARDQETYRSIEQQVASGQLARLLGAQNPYQGFGYASSERFQPHVDVSDGTGLRVAGTGYQLTQGRGSNAQDYEDRYGEIAGEVAGAFNAVDDASASVSKRGLLRTILDFDEATSPAFGWIPDLPSWAMDMPGQVSEMWTGSRPVGPKLPPRRPGQHRSGPARAPAWGW